MNVSLEYFLLIVKEESIVRAAEKLFITPQNLSNHVKRLESKYGTLFIRTPHFQLTAAGAALVKAAQNIKVIEESLDEEIQALQGAETLTVRMGIHAARARMLLPMVMKNYLNKYPQAHIIFHYCNNTTSEELLHNGQIDCFFGIDTKPSEDFLEIPLEDEPVYFACSEELLHQNSVNPFEKTIALADLDKFIYLVSPHTSRMWTKIDVFRRSNSLILKERMNISDFETQIILASQGLGACFIPKMFLPTIEQLNKTLSAGKKLFAFQIEKFTMTSKISLITHKRAYKSEYLQGLIQCIQEYYQEHFVPLERYQR